LLGYLALRIALAYARAIVVKLLAARQAQLALGTPSLEL
jgi:hypothetical protein